MALRPHLSHTTSPHQRVGDCNAGLDISPLDTWHSDWYDEMHVLRNHTAIGEMYRR